MSVDCLKLCDDQQVKKILNMFNPMEFDLRERCELIRIKILLYKL